MSLKPQLVLSILSSSWSKIFLILPGYSSTRIDDMSYLLATLHTAQHQLTLNPLYFSSNFARSWGWSTEELDKPMHTVECKLRSRVHCPTSLFFQTTVIPCQKGILSKKPITKHVHIYSDLYLFNTVKFRSKSINYKLPPLLSLCVNTCS